MTELNGQILLSLDRTSMSQDTACLAESPEGLADTCFSSEAAVIAHGAAKVLRVQPLSL